MNAGTEQIRVDAIVADLRAVSSWLLEAGPAPAAASRNDDGNAWQPTLHRIQDFGALLPRLLEELLDHGPEWATDLVSSRTPRHATPSRAPRDYLVGAGGRLVPTRWLRAEPVRGSDPQAVAWLEHLAVLLDGQHAQACARVARHLDDLLEDPLAATASEYARAHSESLERLRSELNSAGRILERCHAELREVAGWQLTPTPRRPWPFPGGRTWARMVEFAARIEDPRIGLPLHLQELLGAPSTADVPHLYERWCALMVVEGLRRAGLTLAQDPVAALFLGGRLDFVAADPADRRRVRLWITPWILPATAPEEPHESGLSTRDAKVATPDMLLVTGDGKSPGRAFVLDPTWNQGAQQSLSKARYRTRLAFHQPQKIAGVPARQPPARAWAAQPLERSTCLLHDHEGRTGVVPLHPVQRDFAGLDAWLADLW